MIHIGNLCFPFFIFLRLFLLFFLNGQKTKFFNDNYDDDDNVDDYSADNDDKDNSSYQKNHHFFRSCVYFVTFSL